MLIPSIQPFISIETSLRPLYLNLNQISPFSPMGWMPSTYPFHRPRSFTIIPSWMTLAEYKEIRALKNEPFSHLIEKYGLERLSFAFSKERLNQKFEAEYGTLPLDDLIQKHAFSTLLSWNRAGIVSNEKMETVKSALKFSDLYPRNPLSQLQSVFGKEGLKTKFAQEFDALSDLDLQAKFDEETLQHFSENGVIGSERMEKLQNARKEAIRSDTSPFSQLLKTHGQSRLADAFSVEELTEKFNAEATGKSEKDILADIDLDFLTSDLGRAVIGDRFEKFFEKEGVIKIEKDGIAREFYISKNFLSTKEYTAFG